MLGFVIGPAMSGKTRYLQNLATQPCGAATLFLVPEQFVFETEAMLLELGGPQVIRGCEVLSLSRLARRLGAEGCKAADAAAKQALTRIAVLQVEDGLEFYKKQARRPDFAALAVDVLKRFKRAGLTPERLAELALSATDARLKAKLNDFYLISASCRTVMGERYFDPDDDLFRLSEILRDNNPYRGARILIDSFSDFSAAEYQVLRQLICGSGECIVSLDGDEAHFLRDKSPDGTFYIPNKTAARLTEYALADGVEIAKPVFLGRPRYNSATLAAAEAAVRDAQTPALPDDGSVRLYICETQQQEAALLAENVSRLVREKGWRYDDIAVICREPDSWRGLADRAMTACGIPFFWDRRKPLSGTPLCRFLLLALSVCTDGGADELIACLKSGFFAPDGAEICRLENYAFVNGKRGSEDWNTPWDDPELEKLREQVITPLNELAEKLKNCGPKDFAKAIYDFTERVGVQKRLSDLAALEKMPRLEAVMTDPLRSYNSIISLLDSFVNTLDLPSVRLNTRQYIEIFKLMASAVTIGEIPQYIDALHFGGAGLIRTANPKAVFIIGANKDIFPAPPGEPTPFTMRENRMMAEAGAELDKSVDDTVAAENLLVYSCCFCPSDMLVVSCSEADSTGSQQLYPADFFTRLSQMLPQSALCRGREISFAERATCPAQAAALLPQATQSERASLCAALSNCGENELARRIEQAASQSDERRAPLAAQRIFGSSVRLSASKVEDFLTCRFRYFCSSVLRVNKLRPGEIDGASFGTAYHLILQTMFSRYPQPGSISGMEDGEVETQIRQILRESNPTVFDVDPDKNGRAAFLNRRLEIMARTDLKRLDEIMLQEKFRPAALELALGEEDTAPLKLGGRLQLEIIGKPDRIDSFTDRDGQQWLRAVDYKTGSPKTCNENSIRDGLQLQLVYYLQALCQSKRFEGAKPGGWHYYFLAGDGKPKLLGLRADSTAVSEAMGDLSNYRNGRKNAPAADMEEIFKMADGHAEKMAEELADGIFDASPRKSRDCQYCDYARVCFGSKTPREDDGEADGTDE